MFIVSSFSKSIYKLRGSDFNEDIFVSILDTSDMSISTLSLRDIHEKANGVQIFGLNILGFVFYNVDSYLWQLNNLFSLEDLCKSTNGIIVKDISEDLYELYPFIEGLLKSDSFTISKTEFEMLLDKYRDLNVYILDCSYMDNFLSKLSNKAKFKFTFGFAPFEIAPLDILSSFLNNVSNLDSGIPLVNVKVIKKEDGGKLPPSTVTSLQNLGDNLLVAIDYRYDWFNICFKMSVDNFKSTFLVKKK